MSRKRMTTMLRVATTSLMYGKPAMRAVSERGVGRRTGCVQCTDRRTRMLEMCGRWGAMNCKKSADDMYAGTARMATMSDGGVSVPPPFSRLRKRCSTPAVTSVLPHTKRTAASPCVRVWLEA